MADDHFADHLRFYSLSCETYSGTYRRERLLPGRVCEFLFAVVRDVQRNGDEIVTAVNANGFYSLSCETYSGTTGTHTGTGTTVKFLFAVVRDVQRNHGKFNRGSVEGWVSIRCRARRTAEPFFSIEATNRRQAFLFAVVRDVQRNLREFSSPIRLIVSIRCRARRTAERRARPRA